jgi:hypothetical protein
MALELSCSCGRSLTLRDELAGKLIRCPQCQAALQVPTPIVEAVEVVEALEPIEVVEEAVIAGPPPLPPRHEEYVEVELIEEGVSAGPPPLLKSKPREDYSVAPPPLVRDQPRPAEKKKKKKGSVYSQFYGKQRKESVVFEEGWFGDANGGIIGGALMVLISLVLFGLLLALGARFIRAMLWSIILFVIGVVAILKGLMDLYEK